MRGNSDLLHVMGYLRFSKRPLSIACLSHISLCFSNVHAFTELFSFREFLFIFKFIFGNKKKKIENLHSTKYTMLSIHNTNVFRHEIFHFIVLILSVIESRGTFQSCIDGAYMQSKKKPICTNNKKFEDRFSNAHWHSV